MLQGMAGVLGEVPLAAHVMLQSLNQFTFPFSMSVGTAATTRVGNLLGGNDGAQARLVLHLALSIAFVINIVLSSLIYTQRDRVGHIYSSDERAIAAAAEVMGTYVRQTASSLQTFAHAATRGCCGTGHLPGIQRM